MSVLNFYWRVLETRACDSALLREQCEVELIPSAYRGFSPRRHGHGTLQHEHEQQQRAGTNPAHLYTTRTTLLKDYRPLRASSMHSWGRTSSTELTASRCVRASGVRTNAFNPRSRVHLVHFCFLLWTFALSGVQEGSRRSTKLLPLLSVHVQPLLIDSEQQNMLRGFIFRVTLSCVWSTHAKT